MEIRDEGIYKNMRNADIAPNGGDIRNADINELGVIVDFGKVLNKGGVWKDHGIN